MSIAALVRRMAEAGATPEVIALAIEAVEAEQAKDAARRARAAEKKRRQRAGTNGDDGGDSPGTVPGQGGDKAGTVHDPVPSPGSPLPLPQTQTPTPLNPPSSTEREGRASGAIVELRPSEKPPPEKRAHRLPADFKITPNDIDHARREGLNDDQIRREFDRFRDHWAQASGANAAKRDWHAAWRNWVRTAADRLRTTGRYAAGGGGPQGGSRLAAMQRAAAHFRDQDDVSE